MEVNIPREFKIGATRAVVSFAQYLGSDDGYDGTYNRRTGILSIDTRLDSEKRDRTFGHELMEVIKENYELEISEHDMSVIANGWLEFLWQLGITLDWSGIE